MASGRPATRRWCVLSGAGSGIWWQLGVVQALGALGVRFDRWSGSSAGALVAAAGASGRLDLLSGLVGRVDGRWLWGSETAMRRYLRLARTRGLGGWLRQDRLRSLIGWALPDAALRRVASRALYVHVSDWSDTSRRIVATESVRPLETLRKAILASTAIPVVFPPVPFRLGDRRVQGIDGGVTDNLPAEYAAHIARSEAGQGQPWQLWIVSATSRPRQGWVTRIEDGASRLVSGMLWAERDATVNRLEDLGFQRGSTLRVIDARGLDIDLIDFTREDAVGAWERGYSQAWMAAHP